MKRERVGKSSATLEFIASDFIVFQKNLRKSNE